MKKMNKKKQEYDAVRIIRDTIKMHGHIKYSFFNIENHK